MLSKLKSFLLPFAIMLSLAVLPYASLAVHELPVWNLAFAASASVCIVMVLAAFASIGEVSSLRSELKGTSAKMDILDAIAKRADKIAAVNFAGRTGILDTLLAVSLIGLTLCGQIALPVITLVSWLFIWAGEASCREILASRRTELEDWRAAKEAKAKDRADRIAARQEVPFDLALYAIKDGQVYLNSAGIQASAIS